jgi:phage replication-related protein YjqB (UPF0714/DUF867 family)
MPDLYADYAALAAAETEGVDYTRTAQTPSGAWWAAIAIHGGLIEAGTGPLAKQVADLRRMAFYEFKGIRAGSQPDLHITSENFDEPNALALVAKAGRILSFHGFTGTTGVEETLIGGLDAGLRDKVMAALVAAGFTVSVAASEYPGTSADNICNKSATGAGVQLELSRAQREAFFPGGDLTLPTLDDPDARTATFDAYAAAVASAMVPTLVYDAQLSRVRLSGVAPGWKDNFGRTVVDGWEASTSGHNYITVGAATAFQVNGGVGKHIHTAAAVSRWSLAATLQADWDEAAEVSTDLLAAGGGQFHLLIGRSTDDGATCYAARVEFSATQTVILTLRKRVAGTETLLVQHTTGLTHAAGTAVRFRFQGLGSQLRAKAWLASGTEPAAWQLTTTDTDVTGTGRVGIRSILASTYTGTLPVTSSWGNAVSYSKATVQRSTDGVRWTTVRGAATLAGDAFGPVAVDDYEFVADVANQWRIRTFEPSSGRTLAVAQDSLAPDLAGVVWLKSVVRPFLNRPVRIRDQSDFTRPSRSGRFPIVGRSLPVAVTDVRGGKQFVLEVYAADAVEARVIDLLLASGDILFVHTPATGRLSRVPSGYVDVGDSVEEILPTADYDLGYFALPCAHVAAPTPDVVGVTYTCQGVLNDYATCADLLAAFATCADLLDNVGSAEDIIVE